MKESLLPYNIEVVRLDNVTTGYIDRRSTKLVSEAISASILNGELVALIGANGCGKSTLMRCVGGLQKVLSGCIFVDEIDVMEMSATERAKKLSFVLTDQIESVNLTVYDIVSNGRYPHIGYLGKLSDKDWQIVEASLESCSLSGWGDRMFSSLSDGEKQRVLIARALAQDTPLMLLDEPTAHLDLPNRVELMRMLNDLAKKTGKAILLSTHELDLAMQWADTIWLMGHDRTLQYGVPEDIILSRKVGQTFGSHNILFDMETGIFKSNKSQVLPICVNGEGINRIWTERALQRIGYQSCNLCIEGSPLLSVKEEYWELLIDEIEYRCETLGEVIHFLQNKYYWELVLRR